ncbi:MAG: hypothetical protein N4A47_05045 [Clostridia bacterium]|jgi:hypothetical protein|nr:hypothetical protein [Clostridia bacterium]
MKDSRGSVSLLLVVALMLLTLIGIYGLSITMTTYKIAKLDSYKSLSDSLAEDGLKRYLKEVADFYKNKTDIVDADGFNSSGDILNSLGTVIGKYTYDYDRTNDNIFVDYVLKKKSKTKFYDHSIYSLTPPIETQFTPLTHKLPLNAGQIDISGVFNKVVNILETYAVTYDTSDSTLKVFLYQSFVDDRYNLKSEISIKDLYKQKDASSIKTSLSMQDDLEIQALWNPNYNSVEVYIAIGDKEAGIVDVFRINPYLEPIEYEHVDTLTSPFKQMVFGGVHEKNMNDTELFIGLLTDTKFTLYNSYPTIGADGRFNMTSADFADDLNITAERIDMTVIWNKILNATNIYVGTVPTSNDKVNYYLFLPHISEEVVNQTELELNTANQGADFAANQITVCGYFDEAFNTVQLYSVIGDYEANTLNSYMRFIGESNWNKEAVAMDAGDGVGRLSSTGGYSRITEVMFVNASPIARYVRVDNSPTTPNITATAESQTGGDPKSKTELKAGIRIEYTEFESGGARTIESVDVIEYNKN